MRGSVNRCKWIGTWLILSLLVCVPAPSVAFDAGSAKTATRPGFTLPADGPLNILILQSEIKVTEQTAAGLPRPSADWTALAREALTHALGEELATRQGKAETLAELSVADTALVHDYRNLFDSIAQSVISYKLLSNDRLPSKEGRFDWTMGEGLARLDKGGAAQYGLFYGTSDSYASKARTSVETVQVALGMDVGKGEHRGYAGLVDLKTGDLVWFKVDVRMSGDVRTAEGAKRRVAQLLSGFPKRGADE